MTPRKILEEVLNIMQTNILVDVADIKPILKSMDIEIKYKELNGNKAYTNSEEVNTIYFGNQFKKDEKVEMDTLIHEIGHILYFRKKMWDKKLKSEKEQITKYNENDMERFAENFKIYFLRNASLDQKVRKELDTLIPSNYKKLIFNILKLK